ncbi:hypothetical protein L1049_017023 [Liquidambar formosana]|uniref:RING-type domain-containing protein n=1 Tax=Liquidambar formosana TaxID=63359 RepID=A0AAP0X104_LIQFO
MAGTLPGVLKEEDNHSPPSRGPYNIPPQSEFQANEGGGWKHRARTKDTGLGSKILGRPWQFHLNSSKSDSGVCAVCLEDFGAEEQVMDLSCSHKYHSKCLLPWLAAHPHCPYCRRPVGS